MGASGAMGHPGQARPRLSGRVGCAVAALFCLPALGAPPALPEPPPVKGAAGRVIQYEEAPSGRILYKEEGGVTMRPVAPAVPGSRRDPLPPIDARLEATRPTAVATKKPVPVAATKKPPELPAVARAPRPPTWGERVDAAIDRRDSAALLALASGSDAAIACASPYRAWAIARAQDESGDRVAATGTLDRVAGCEDERTRLSTLEIARAIVDGETLARWMAREVPAARTPEASRRYDQLAYTLALERHQASRAPAGERARALDREAGAGIVAYRDAAAATGLGWLWLESGDPASAALWFGRANTWAPGTEEAVRGLAYAALRERRFDEAMQLAASLPREVEDRAKIEREAWLGLADRAYNFDRYAQALEYFERAASTGPLPRYAQSMQAWSYVRLGNKDEGARRFAALYRESPDRPTAEGILAAVDQRTMIDADLAATEPLSGLLRAERAIAAFSARRYIAAAALDPARYGNAGGYGAPQASIFAGHREKTGDDGLSRLKPHTVVVAEAGMRVGEEAALRVRIDSGRLEAGRPAPTSLLGSAPIGAAPVAFEETRADVDAGRVTLRWEREIAVTASAGVVSADAGLARQAVGGIEFEATPEWGQLAGALTREPVRESVLSYVGMRDPYGGPSWGRVARTSVSGRVLALKNAPWSIGAAARVSRLTGVNVQSNTQQNAEISAGYDFGLPGFAYSAASVSLGGDRYERNLGGFTTGHGGYFSPQRYRRAGAAIDFMTADDRQWLVRGRASAGLISKSVDEAPVLPLSPDGRVYPATPKERGHDASVQVAGVLRVSPHVQLAGGISRSTSPQWGETIAFLQVRVLFEPRRSVVSADLPAPRVD